MDDTELEEGEACSYRDDDVDPDIALAYIDEKLHDVLGHFQKDFEGGVSAENLGAKFGGYGSFLPTYQRSPVCTDTRAQKVKNHALRSPSKSQLEGGFHNITTAASACEPVPCSDISNTRTMSAIKPLTTRDPLNLDSGVERRRAEELISRAKTPKPQTVPEEKKLRVRIRVGSDNVSTQTKAEFYSGLGLVLSPSSFVENSPENEGRSREPHCIPDESPNSIIHIMTSFPLEGSWLLSPLTEDLAHLIGNKKSLWGQLDSASRSETRKSVKSVNGSAAQSSGKTSVLNYKKSSRVNAMSLESNNGGTNDARANISELSKEADEEISACEKLISKAMKLPLLSASDDTASDLPKSYVEMSEFLMGANKATIQLQLSEPSDVNANGLDTWADEKPTTKVGSGGNLWEQERHTEKLVGNTEARLKKSLVHRDGKNHESPCGELNCTKVFKSAEQDKIIYPNVKNDMQMGYQESEVLNTVASHGSFKAKNKLKATLGHAAESVKGKVNGGSSSRYKHDNSKSQGSKSKHGAENSKLHNNVFKSKVTYKDIFGDLKLEDKEKELNTLNYASISGTKDTLVTNTGKLTSKNTMKEDTSIKKIVKRIMSDTHPKTDSQAAPLVIHPLPDAPAPPAPVLIEENWVCCDSCQQWRLLPVGKLPNSLPEKWVCGMLDWLPGMNSCDIEEDETTKALRLFYQASVQEGCRSPLGHVGGSTYGAHSSGWTKKLHSTVKSRSPTNGNRSPALNNFDNQHPKKPSNVAAEKNKKLIQIEQSLHKHSSDGSPNARSTSPCLVLSKDHMDYTDARPYQNHIGEASKKSKDQVGFSVNDSFEKNNDGSKDSSIKKRKANENQESRNSDSLPSAALKGVDINGYLEDSSHRFASKEKKARVSSHLSGSNRESKKGREYLAAPKDLKLAKDPDSVYKGPSRRDLAHAHPFAEVTSSSSKISSSHDIKGNDTNGSPVESVSSLPQRSRRNARHSSNREHTFGNGCPPNDLELLDSPRKYPSCEIEGKSGSVGLVEKENGRTGEVSPFSHKGPTSSILDFWDGVSGGRLEGTIACDGHQNSRASTMTASNFGRYPLEQKMSDIGPHDPKPLSVSLSDKKRPSVQSKDRMQKSKSGSNKSDASILFDSSQDQNNHGNELISEGFDKHTKAKPHKIKKKIDDRKQSENLRAGPRVKSGTNDKQNSEDDTFPSMSHCRKIIVEKLEETPNTFPSEKMDLLETSQLMGKEDMRSQFGCMLTGNGHTGYRGSEIRNTSVDAPRGDVSLKELKSSQIANNQNGHLPSMLRNGTHTGLRSKDITAPSPARRDSSSQSAASAVKEAKSLKHAADRMKSSGSNAESIGIYFQAALKFLLGASLLESSTSETKQGDVIQSTQMYSSTAKLCEFCAREFEKAQDMASAALAYKCTEVAYMRVVYSSHSNANRDRHELQTVLQMAPPGESPSSSASDLDNLNNAVTAEKVLLAKGMNSPQLAGSHVISARSRPSFSRLLNFAQDVSFAMEASKKSRLTLALASAYLEKVQNEDGFILIKRALDYNFQDVEGLLQLVRLGVDEIGR